MNTFNTNVYKHYNVIRSMKKTMMQIDKDVNEKLGIFMLKLHMKSRSEAVAYLLKVFENAPPGEEVNTEWKTK
jgi:hypothetical protein